MQEIDDYFSAWNEPLIDRRRSLLEGSVSADVEVIHPTWGRSAGIDALMKHIDGYRSALPRTAVVRTSALDAHNDVVRYGWDIIDENGEQVMEGIDIVELAGNGRLKRILLFHGKLDDP